MKKGVGSVNNGMESRLAGNGVGLKAIRQPVFEAALLSRLLPSGASRGSSGQAAKPGRPRAAVPTFHREIRRLLCRHFKKYIQRRVIPIFDDGLFIIFYTLRLLIDLVGFYLILHEPLFISKHSRSRLSTKNLLKDLK